MSEHVVNSFVEIELTKPDDFLKIKETLSRTGVSSNKNKTLYQSCHILHKKGRYYIVHFKELFLLDGKEATLSDVDIGRRNVICRLLEEWGLLTIVDFDAISEPQVSVNTIKILPFHQKKDWTIVTKYSIGTR